MTHDFVVLLTLGSLVLVLAIVMERLHRKKTIPQWLSRKILHIGAIGTCALAPALLIDLYLMTWIVGIVAVGLIGLVAAGIFFEEENKRRSWGIALFPLSFMVLLLLFPGQRGMIVIPMTLLAFSDAAAAIGGHLLGRRYYSLTGDKKSLAGNLSFALTTALVLFLFSTFGNEALWPGSRSLSPEWFACLALITVLLTALEALGSQGTDNLYVPFGAALLLGQVPVIMEGGSVWMLLGGICMAGLFAWFTVRRGSLDLGGAVAASVMGLTVLIFGGPVALVPLVVFFGLGIVAGKLTARHEIASDEKHGKARDYLQVVCNGGVYAALVIFFRENPVNLWLLMTVTMAISAADTLASEIGMYFRGTTVDILRWKVQPPGLSGGISAQGTAGGLIGAALLAGVGAGLAPGGFSWEVLGIATLAGFIGMLLDSLLGASVQARFLEKNSGRASDFATPDSYLGHGFSWMTNDLVNLVSNLLVTLFIFLLMQKFFS